MISYADIVLERVRLLSGGQPVRLATLIADAEDPDGPLAEPLGRRPRRAALLLALGDLVDAGALDISIEGVRVTSPEAPPLPRWP